MRDTTSSELAALDNALPTAPVHGRPEPEGNEHGRPMGALEQPMEFVIREVDRLEKNITRSPLIRL
eukprot:8680170-Prorocentrum_lima.AAC.1